jgi:hypothetical protein
MQALAAEFSGYRWKIPLLFFGKKVQTGCLDSRISITALKVTRSVCLRAF